MSEQAEQQEQKHIRDLTADPTNRRQHNPRNIGMLVDALHSVGAARSIVVDENDVVLAGNGVVEAAAEAGIHKLRIIDADGDELIAVRRSGLSDEQKRQLAMYDNRVGELAEWNVEQLQLDAADGLDLAPFFSDAELGKMGVDQGAQGGGGGAAAALDAGRFVIVVELKDEADQTKLLEQLLQEGYECRAVVS